MTPQPISPSLPQRPLTLHHSALTNEELKLYTTSLAELTDVDLTKIADDHLDEWEKSRLSMRETRGWLRGKYGEMVSVGDIDQILGFFHPNHNPLGVLTGGEYFAVMRLIHHAMHGRHPTKQLIFIQANYASDTQGHRATLPPHSPTPSNPFMRSPASSHYQHQTMSDVASTSSVLSSRSAPANNNHAGGVDQFATTTTTTGNLPHSPANPFLSRSKSISSPSSAASFMSSSVESPVTPPLPPRKPSKPLLPPPRHLSIVQGAGTSSSSSPHVPVVPPFRHANSGLGLGLSPSSNPNSLIQQSLKVAKMGRTAKEAEKTAKQERYLEVIASNRSTPLSSPNPTDHSSPLSSTSGNKPPPPLPPPMPSLLTNGSSSTITSTSSSGSDNPPGSGSYFAKSHLLPEVDDIRTTSSYEHVASATIPAVPSSASHSRSATVHHLSSTAAAPPSSPSPFDSPPISSAPSQSQLPPARMQRSYSMSRDSPPPPGITAPSRGEKDQPPVPPPRRRRPESVQVFSSSPSFLSQQQPPSSAGGGGGDLPSYLASIQRGGQAGSAKLMRTLSSFGGRAKREDEERLVGDDDDDDAGLRENERRRVVGEGWRALR